MLNKVLPIIIVLIAVGGAGYAAMMMKGGPQPAPKAAADHGTDEVHGVKPEDLAGVGYFDFQRNFLVPVIGDSEVQAIVLMTLSIEMDESAIEEVRGREPRIRDQFMKTLLALSHEGVFDNDITDPATYETIRVRLSRVGQTVVHESVRSVLIVDFGRQDQF